MLDSAIVDVAIGVIVIFLASSLIAAAIVEAVGSFLHRRQKHLWDSLDLLLGNTSVAEDSDLGRIVGDLYRTPFITGLVKPADRPFFDSAAGRKRWGTKVEVRPRAKKRNRKARVSPDRPEDLNRRFYGPQHIAPREFANAFLSYVRPGGELDQAIDALADIREKAESGATDVALGDLGDALDELEAAAVDVGSNRLAEAVAEVRAAGGTIDVDRLKALAARIDQALTNLRTGELTPEELRAGIALLPRDLQEKLGEVLAAAGGTFVEMRQSLEDWFDRNMAAASEWYRRQTRWFLFAAGLVVAVTMNVDAVSAGLTLYRDEGTREALVAVAEDIQAADCGRQPAEPDSQVEPDESRPSAQAQQDLDCVRNGLDESIALPVGWSQGLAEPANGWPIAILGWLLVATAATVGAPFWFDLLRRALDHRKSRQGESGR